MARRRTASCGPAGQDRRAGRLEEVRPALPPVVDVLGIEAGLVEESGERETGTLPTQRSELVDLRRPAGGDRLPKAAQHDLARLRHRGACGNRRAGTGTGARRPARRRAVILRAARGIDGRSGTPFGECRRSRAPCSAPCPVVLRSPLPSCWRNSVGLSVGRSMRIVSTAGTSTPSLNRSTEKTMRTSPPARSLRAASRSPWGLSPHTATAAMPWLREVAGHEAGMFDAHAEAERSHLGRVDVLADFLDDEASPRVGAGVGGAERLDVVALSPPPWDVAEVDPVVDTVVEERRQVLLVDRIPQSELGGDPVVEPVQDGQPVAALRCCGETEQLDGTEMVEDPCVRRGGGVVELVDDHHVEVVGREQVESPAFRLWTDAKTWSKRVGRAPPTHFSPNVASRSTCGKWPGSGRGSPRDGRRRAAATGRAVVAGERSRPPPSPSCRFRSRTRAGCGGGRGRGRPR